ncbi:TetR/AcrR family transcriptional regulator C-terminal domain-containing protein [Mycolicibacterium sp.]|uniref:TetR/AcrR family transcriptional regulator C-terminal domain-containing protein n=1 Tax=Mycolicibacterium sp. TaxID=2320850 RepID=UPI003D1392D0
MTANEIDDTTGEIAKPRRRRRNSLNQEQIVHAALTILSRDGYYGLSIAKLAKELECGQMSLYSHIRDKRHLLDLVVQELFKDVYLPKADEPWTQEVSRQMRGYRTSLLAHPGLGRIVAEGMIRSSAIDRFLEAGLACVRNQVGDEELTVRVFFSLLIFTMGSVVHESAKSHARPRSSYVERWYDRESEWPEGAYPQMRATMPYLITIADDVQFDFAFEALLAGLVEEVRRTKS